MTSMMIRPRIPRFPDFASVDPAEAFGYILCASLIIVSAVIAALLVARYASGRYSGNKKKTALCFACITALVTAALICFFGCSVITVKGILLSLILTFSSYADIKERECDDYLHVMILIAAFIGTDLSSLPNMLFSALFTGGLMLFTMIVTRSFVGGADVKAAAACSFLLGLSRGVLGLIAAMILAVAVNVFKKDKKKGFPMIPYLAAGYTAAYFFTI